MKKAILISIRPKWVAKILNGEKTLEIRKSMPKCDLPIDVYIYCTKDKNQLVRCQEKVWGYYKHTKGALKSYFNGKVVAKFTLNKVEKINSYFEPEQWYMTRELGGRKLMEKSCLSFSKLDDYLFGRDGCAWHIENLEIFDEPKELSEFYTAKTNKLPRYLFPLTRAPQSWVYIEV